MSEKKGQRELIRRRVVSSYHDAKELHYRSGIGLVKKMDVVEK